MDIPLKAIDTSYKGYLFRSRLEARWAVFLDSFREEWGYEVEGYELPSGWYLPDFWLPRLYCWLEIKGQEPTELEKRLCYELAHATGKPVAMAWGLPSAARKRTSDYYTSGRFQVFCFDCTDSSGGEGWWNECFWALDQESNLCICSNDSFPSREFMTPSYKFFPGMKQIRDIQKPIDESHVNKAKSARFEFQREQGITRPLSETEKILSKWYNIRPDPDLVGKS